MTRIALFGTSADPPTIGHQAILMGLAQQFDRVWVWASDNPFKQHGASLTHRSQMLALIVTEANQHFPGCPIDLRPDLSHRHTIVTVEQARRQYPHATFHLVVGSDLLRQLPQWYRSADLLQQVRLLVIPRPDFPIDPAEIDRLQHLGTEVTIAQWEGLPVSSTVVRQDGRTDPLTAPVHDFIQEHQLYPALLEIA